MNIRSVILDDELHCIETLQWQLEKYAPAIELIHTFESPISALDYVQANPIDLLFLDIEMPEMNGFELLQQCANLQFDVIFTTAYDEFAVKAFKASAIDYLLKPIDKNDLISAVRKVQEANKAPIKREQMEIFHQAINPQKPVKERIAVPTQDGLHFVKIKEIMYCISDSNYTFIHMDDKKKILVSRTLKEIEGMLADEGFLRIHNSHLINLSKIEKYMRGDGGFVIMDDQKALSVSRSRKDALLQYFGH